MTPFEGEHLQVEGERVVMCPHCRHNVYRSDAYVTLLATGHKTYDCTMCGRRWHERDGIVMWDNETGAQPTRGGHGR